MIEAKLIDDYLDIYINYLESELTEVARAKLYGVVGHINALKAKFDESETLLMISRGIMSHMIVALSQPFDRKYNQKLEEEYRSFLARIKSQKEGA